MFKNTMIIATVLASSALSFDGEAQAHTHRRGHGHTAFVHSAGFAHGYGVAHGHGYRHGGHAFRHGGRFHHFAAREERSGWIRSSRAASLVQTSVAGGGAVVGRASFYSGGGRTANGGSVGSATCAHRSLPFGTKVLVTNLANLRQAVLTVNDRGPFVHNRVLDVSRGAAGLLGMLHAGISQIRMQVVGGPG